MNHTNAMMMTLVEERLTTQSAREPLAAIFRYRHLPADQSALAFPFAELAMQLIDTPTIAPKARQAALDSLLDARLAVVPEAIETDEPAGEPDGEPEAPAKKPRRRPKA